MALELTIAGVKAAARKALEEGRLQAAQKSPGVKCRYRSRIGKKQCCCVIGAALPDDIAAAGDKREAAVYKLVNDDIIAFSNGNTGSASALQREHDKLCFGTNSRPQAERIAILRELLAD